eukprot:4700018-Prorocentrum_lima.AAC.1
MNYFPDGVDLKYYCAISPPCAGLQDVAWHIRTDNCQASVLEFPEHRLHFHLNAVAEIQDEFKAATHALSN